MTDDIEALERRIAADRTRLTDSVTALTQALSPGRLSYTVAREVQARSGSLSKTALNAARANPAGALLVGAGIAAVLAGPKRPTPDPASETRTNRGEHDHTGAAARTASADAPRPESQETMQATPRAPGMRAALNRGLADLPAPARARVIKAREAAIEVQEKLDRKAAVAARKARSFHHRQPLSTGALALGLGAIVAALLPRTRIEDDMLGAKRDALLELAELTLSDELAAATAAGEAAVRDNRNTGADRPRRN